MEEPIFQIPTSYQQPINSESVVQTPKKFKLRNLIFVLLAAIIGVLGFYFVPNFLPKGQKATYEEPYRLTPEKISQSAMIRINLPPKIDKEFAKNNIKFSPALEGNWAEAESNNFFASIAFAKDSDSSNDIIYYKPSEKLELNRHYAVELSMENGETIGSDFLAVEDPQIIAVFPSAGSESPENSEITIVFNRPMVPLTTLQELEEKNVPVEISPSTEGRFKWISTRNLQFIPKERLVRSAHYKVRIKDGLTSTDGLSVKGTEMEFTTRNLRYLDNISMGETVYDQPISIYFNQPVDLEKTKNEITLTDTTNNRAIPFIVEYGAKSVSQNNSQNQFQEMGLFGISKKFLASLAGQLGFNFNPFSQKQDQQEVDKSVLKIYNQKDKFGREKFWDFDTSYALQISKAYPSEGDIILNEARQTSINVNNIIKTVTAESQKTSSASSDFFDPQGKLWVEFYEEINLDKSTITTSKLKDIGYGEKCVDEMLSFSDCLKMTDKKKIYITYKDQEIGLGEALDVNFEKIVNFQGLVINKNPIKYPVVSYPKFSVVNTFPENNSAGASLTGMVLCSNSPLLIPPRENYKDYIKSNLDYEINYWGNSWRVVYLSDYEKCGIGQFHTDINYGLMPQSDYSLQFNLEDVFGQKYNFSLKFTTGLMDSEDRYFYQFQNSYNVTSPEKTKLAFGVKNMEYVNLEICKLSAKNFLYYLENKLNWYSSSANLPCQDISRKTINLPQKYWITNRFNVDIKDYFNDPTGHYILTFSNPNYNQEYYAYNVRNLRQIFERSYLTITNLAVTEKIIQPETAFYGGSIQSLNQSQSADLKNLYWVTNLPNLNPVINATVSLYQGDELNLAGTYNTGEQGIALTNIIANLRGAIVSQGNDSTVIPNWESKLNWASSAYSAKNIYLYTDKPIYRPSQEVFLKGIYRIGYDGNYEIYRDKKVNLKVYNSKNDEIMNQNLDVNEYGTFNTKLVLEQGAPLGNYRFCVDQSACGYFDVQEYVPAAFQVNIKSDKEEYISKDKAVLDVEANYYFGVALDAGDVEYTISSQDYYFDKYSDEYFNFGTGWYYQAPYSFGEKFIMRGKTVLDSDGKAKISQELDLEKLFKNESDRKSKIIIVDVTVKNAEGQSVSSQKSFILHAGEFYMGQNSDKFFVGKNEEFVLKTKTVDTAGNETRENGITLSLYKVGWSYAKRQEATGGYSYQWEKKRDFIEKHNFSTDGNGNHEQKLKIADEGEYEAELTAKDGKGNLIKSVYNLYVYGEGQVAIKPTNDTKLEVVAGKNNLNVGETGSLVIKSPYQNAKALIAIERGKIFDYQVKDITGNLYEYKFDIKEDYVPNIFVSVLLQSGSPEVKFGSAEFKVNTKEKELNIDVKTNKNSYLPGEEVNLDILAKDSKGKPVSSEISLSVVDLSVLALKGNPKKNPLVFFYGGFPLTVQTSSNIKNILTQIDIPTKGGGGQSDEVLAKKARGIFKETAFWQANVRTDANGKANVKFVLPDNLTTWQTEALGVTKDTKLGISYKEFITQKDLMVVPLKPRFVIPGDIFNIGAKIFNQSKDKQKINIVFNSDTLSLQKGSSKKSVTLDSGKNATVYFEVQAPVEMELGEHQFSLSAKSNKNLEDTVLQYITITPNNTYEVTATANYTPAKLSKEYVFLPNNVVKDKGELTIKSSATLAVFLSDALNYLLQYPYGCAEQVASQLNSIAVVKRGLNLPNLGDKLQLDKIKHEGKEYTIDEVAQLGLAQLYDKQNYDGGFSYWQLGQSNFYLTLHVVEALKNVSLAGYQINQNSLNKAANYIYTHVTSDGNLYNDKNNIILATYALSGLPNFSDQSGVLKGNIIAIANNDGFIKDKISSASLAYLSILLNNGNFDNALKTKVASVLDNRVDIDSRGSFLEPNKNLLWYNYETTIQDTALYLKALSAAKNSNPIIDKVVRWILNSREKDGAWGSTNNTLTVVNSFTDFLQWKRETESNFTLDLSINNKKEDSFDFKPATILDTLTKLIPLKNLKFNENNVIQFEKTDHNNLSNNLYYDASLKYYLPAESVAPRDEGFSITRGFYAVDDKQNKNPLTKAKVGDVLKVHLQIIVPKSRNFAIIEDYIPAGMEIVNLDLATEQKSLLLQEKEIANREFFPDFKEIRDDRAFLYKERLDPGVYEFDYFVRALIGGKFAHLPAVASEMYFPENFGRTAGEYFEIE